MATVVDAGSPESPESSEDRNWVPGFDGVGLSGFVRIRLIWVRIIRIWLIWIDWLQDAVFVRASSTPLTSDASVFRPSFTHIEMIVRVRKQSRKHCRILPFPVSKAIFKAA